MLTEDVSVLVTDALPDFVKLLLAVCTLEQVLVTVEEVDCVHDSVRLAELLRLMVTLSEVELDPVKLGVEDTEKVFVLVKDSERLAV